MQGSIANVVPDGQQRLLSTTNDVTMYIYIYIYLLLLLLLLLARARLSRILDYLMFLQGYATTFCKNVLSCHGKKIRIQSSKRRLQQALAIDVHVDHQGTKVVSDGQL